MKNFIQSLVFCHKEVYRSNKKTFIQIYLLTTPLAFEGLIWALANKELVDILTSTLSSNKVFSLYALQYFFLLAVIWLLIVPIGNLLYRHIREKLWRDHHIYFHEQFTLKVDSIDLQTFEDSNFLDTLQNSQESNKAVIDTFFTAVMLYRHILMGIISLISISLLSPIIPVVVGLLTWLNIHINHKYYEKRQIIDREATPDRRMRGQLFNYFFNPSSIIEMRIYALQDELRKRYGALDRKIHDTFMKLNNYFLPIKIFASLLEGLLADLGARLYIFYLTLIKRITLGQFAFFVSQIGTFSSALHRIGDGIDTLNESMHRMKYYLEFLEVNPVLDNSNSKVQIKSGVDIEFRNVSFCYPGTNIKVLNNFSLKINRGEKVALIGLNGAGKTTIIKLLLRFYDPDNGDVLINGINLKNIDINELYGRVGFMAQNYMTYELSVLDNVRFGRYEKDYNADQIKQALLNASAWDYVNAYPDGINQMLGRKFANSIQPSIGQWQKIGLARSFYRDPELLILDEPTSSIDAKAESEIFEKVENLSKDKTVIIISHRFSTVRKADRIYLIKDGQIEEEGTHSELVKINGTYSQLFELQAKGYK